MPSFKEPSHTQVPNEFFPLAKDLSEVEIRVLLQIFRDTYGWHCHRQPFEVRRADLVEPTGLSQPGVKKGLIGLVEKGYLLRETRDGLPSIYRLNVESNPDTPVSDPRTQPGYTRIRQSVTPVSGSAVLTTSLGKKKESISPTHLSADAEEPLIDYLQRIAKEHGRSKPVFNPKEGLYLIERDSAEAREGFRQAVEDTPGANVREAILSAAGYTGRKAPERKGFNRGATSERFMKHNYGPSGYVPRPEEPRRMSQLERVREAVAKRLGITE